MQSLHPNLVVEDDVLQHKKTIIMPEGLPAFEQVKDYVLIANEEEAPFLWLQAVSSPNLSFVVVDPFLICEDYRPDISDDDVEFLELADPSDAIVLSIVNIHAAGGEGITANLVGPIVINIKKRIGKQVILQNHLSYSVRHRIDTGE